ncbi:MAG: Holliday junction resolvase RuvX [Nevskia sp.]|nr:Holliday junction resolvase RuvX [Nevskia sp.]
MTAASQAVYLGFDFGTKRIGLAVGDAVTRSARPLPPLSNGREPDWEALGKALSQWRPAACVVGLPVDRQGNVQAITRQARGFAEQLRIRFGIPVHLCDERLSSLAADDELRSARADGRMNRRVRKGDRDGVAARLILEQWLAENAGAA